MEHYQSIDMNILGNQLLYSKPITYLDSYPAIYSEVVKKTANLLQSLSIQDPFRASLVFEYLLWKGYFSNQKSFSYRISGRDCIPEALGTDIIKGKSACINNSDMHVKVLNELGYFANLLICYTNEEEINSKYRFEVDRSYQNTKIEKNALEEHLRGNHAITLFSYQNRYYAVDVTNCIFLEPTFSNHLKFIGSKKTATIKTISSTICNQLSFYDTSFIKLSQACLKLKKQRLHPHQEKYLTQSNISKLNKEVMEFCIAKEEVFEGFHQRIQPEIHAICKRLKR